MMGMLNAWAKRRRVRRLSRTAQELLVEYRALERMVDSSILADTVLFHAMYPEARQFAQAFNAILARLRDIDPDVVQSALPVCGGRS
jgi:hypothetical protein